MDALSATFEFLDTAFLVSLSLVILAVALRLHRGGARSSPAQVKIPLPQEASAEWKPKIKWNPAKEHMGPEEPCLSCFDPATMGWLGTVQKHRIEELPDMVKRAREAQLEYVQKSSYADRRRLLQSLSDYVLKHQREIAAVCSRDTGKTFIDAFFGEILTTLEKCRWVCQNGEQVLAPEYRSVGGLTLHKRARVEYHPLGVVAAIVSWNYPFHNAFGPIISALFAGNAILIKSSEHVAWSTKNYFEPLIHQLLESHGFSRDLVQFVIGEGDVGSALVNSGVDKVTFIGSPGVGKKVMETAAKTLTPVTLELGGKDAAIICEDVHLDSLIPVIMRGTFQNMGQNCIGLERILVHADIYDEFLERVVPLVKQLRLGAPLGNAEVDCGAITMPRHIKHVKELVDDAVLSGARLLFGGSRALEGGDVDGQFFEPTVLADVKPDMKIAQEETIMKFHSDQEAVEIVNSSPFGLGGSVFSNNVRRAEAIGRLVHTGMCNINDFAVNYLCQSLPFGGVKQSGFGRFAGVEGLRAECVLKAVTCDKISSIKTTIPPILDYPINKDKSAAFCEQLAMTVYGPSVLDKVRGVINLARISIFGQIPKK